MALTADQIMALNFHDYHQKILPYLNGGGMGMKLLWENSDPTQSFSAGDVTLSSSDYDMLIILHRSGSIEHADIVSKGSAGALTYATSNIRTRQFTFTNDTKISFDDAYNIDTYGTSGSVSNGFCKPYRIYGIKVYNRDVPGKTTLLWSNPDPSSAFAAQRITLASSDYDLLCIISSQNVITTQNPHRRSISNIVQKGQGTETEIIIYYQGSVLVRSRAFDYVDDTHLDVSDNTQNGTTNNSDNIPLAVYGIKL